MVLGSDLYIVVNFYLELLNEDISKYSLVVWQIHTRLTKRNAARTGLDMERP